MWCSLHVTSTRSCSHEPKGATSRSVDDVRHGSRGSHPVRRLHLRGTCLRWRQLDECGAYRVDVAPEPNCFAFGYTTSFKIDQVFTSVENRALYVTQVAPMVLRLFSQESALFAKPRQPVEPPLGNNSAVCGDSHVTVGPQPPGQAEEAGVWERFAYVGEPPRHRRRTRLSSSLAAPDLTVASGPASDARGDSSGPASRTPSAGSDHGKAAAGHHDGENTRHSHLADQLGAARRERAMDTETCSSSVFLYGSSNSSKWELFAYLARSVAEECIRYAAQALQESSADRLGAALDSSDENGCNFHLGEAALEQISISFSLLDMRRDKVKPAHASPPSRAPRVHVVTLTKADVMALRHESDGFSAALAALTAKAVCRLQQAVVGYEGSACSVDQISRQLPPERTVTAQLLTFYITVTSGARSESHVNSMSCAWPNHPREAFLNLALLPDNDAASPTNRVGVDLAAAAAGLHSLLVALGHACHNVGRKDSEWREGAIRCPREGLAASPFIRSNSIENVWIPIRESSILSCLYERGKDLVGTCSINRSSSSDGRWRAPLLTSDTTSGAPWCRPRGLKIDVDRPRVTPARVTHHCPCRRVSAQHCALAEGECGDSSGPQWPSPQRELMVEESVFEAIRAMCAGVGHSIHVIACVVDGLEEYRNVLSTMGFLRCMRSGGATNAHASGFELSVTRRPPGAEDRSTLHQMRGTHPRRRVAGAARGTSSSRQRELPSGESGAHPPLSAGIRPTLVELDGNVRSGVASKSNNGSLTGTPALRQLPLAAVRQDMPSERLRKYRSLLGSALGEALEGIGDNASQIAALDVPPPLPEVTFGGEGNGEWPVGSSGVTVTLHQQSPLLFQGVQPPVDSESPADVESVSGSSSRSPSARSVASTKRSSSGSYVPQQREYTLHPMRTPLDERLAASAGCSHDGLQLSPHFTISDLQGHLTEANGKQPEPGDAPRCGGWPDRSVSCGTSMETSRYPAADLDHRSTPVSIDIDRTTKESTPVTAAVHLIGSTAGQEYRESPAEAHERWLSSLARTPSRVLATSFMPLATPPQDEVMGAASDFVGQPTAANVPLEQANASHSFDGQHKTVHENHSEARSVWGRSLAVSGVQWPGDTSGMATATSEAAVGVTGGAIDASKPAALFSSTCELEHQLHEAREEARRWKEKWMEVSSENETRKVYMILKQETEAVEKARIRDLKHTLALVEKSMRRMRDDNAKSYLVPPILTRKCGCKDLEQSGQAEVAPSEEPSPLEGRLSNDGMLVNTAPTPPVDVGGEVLEKMRCVVAVLRHNMEKLLQTLRSEGIPLPSSLVLDFDELPGGGEALECGATISEPPPKVQPPSHSAVDVVSKTAPGPMEPPAPCPWVEEALNAHTTLGAEEASKPPRSPSGRAHHSNRSTSRHLRRVFLGAVRLFLKPTDSVSPSRSPSWAPTDRPSMERAGSLGSEQERRSPVPSVRRSATIGPPWRFGYADSAKSTSSSTDERTDTSSGDASATHVVTSSSSRSAHSSGSSPNCDAGGARVRWGAVEKLSVWRAWRKFLRSLVDAAADLLEGDDVASLLRAHGADNALRCAVEDFLRGKPAAESPKARDPGPGGWAHRDLKQRCEPQRPGNCIAVKSDGPCIRCVELEDLLHKESSARQLLSDELLRLRVVMADREDQLRIVLDKVGSDVGLSIASLEQMRDKAMWRRSERAGGAASA